MAHILAPRPSEQLLPVFFNLDTSVGRMGANSNYEDILLVQFMLKALANNMTTPEGRRVQPILSATPQTGNVDPATIRSIEAFQGAMTIEVVGRVSSARGYRYGRLPYTIVHLNASLRED